jgi:hypothetical protein
LISYLIEVYWDNEAVERDPICSTSQSNLIPSMTHKNRIDYSTSFTAEGKLVDMEHPVSRAALLAEPRELVPRTLVARAHPAERRRGSSLHS